MIRFLTAGESHGKCLTLIVEGIPAGVKVSAQDIDKDLRRRQIGYGRGERMKIESDRAEITSGVRAGVTLGSPISVMIQNKDWENWQRIMSVEGPASSADSPPAGLGEVTNPRPGHADLPGGIKYHHKDLRNVLERASARETAARVAVGAIAKRLLKEFGIYVISFTAQIGECQISNEERFISASKLSIEQLEELQGRIDSSPLRCPDTTAEKCMISAIDSAKADGDSLGGVFQIIAFNVPPGIGSHVHWDRRLDARIAYAVMSIPAVKGIEIGMGFSATRKKGSQVHDEIYYDPYNGFYRKTNNAGGIEGGISNGEAIVIKAAMKPIPTLTRPLRSVDLISKSATYASKERADICAVPSAGVIGEAVIAVEIANALLEKFGGDSVLEIRQSFESYMNYVRNI